MKLDDYMKKNGIVPEKREFPEGKENYCPRCYFEEEKTILRAECPHQSPSL